MKAKKYFIIPFLALLAASCQDEERTNMSLASGEDVTFGATLEQNSTRTIYGEEANGAFPIYWVNGDEVIVSSSDCANAGGVGSATYRVTVGGASQNYASSLDKTGEIGVRWGDNETAEFYSVYPASHATAGSNYSTVTLTMPAQQDNGYDRTTMKVQPDMNACFMYAVTEGVTNGSTVNLRYKPLSTAVRFKLTGPASGEVSINYVRIFAPEGTNINGTFSADFANRDGNGCPKMTATRGLNYVTFNVADDKNTYLTLANGANIEVNAFLLLEGETQITDDWYIEIGTTAGISFKKYLDADPGAADNRTLVPGMIHRLPDLPPLEDTSDEWNPANWMANLQRNVYLSEISIPGSWNSMNSDCQYSNGATNIEEQYKAGIRAFHIDTRWKAGSHLDLGITTNYGKIDGLGVADGSGSDEYLSWDGIGTANRLMNCHAPNFSDVLKEITRHVKDDEYMVVVCTIAQDSYDYNRDNGGWKKEVSDVCANNPDVFDASTITPETVVKDVLGKVIVIVNTNNFYQIDRSKCLFMNMGISLNEDEYTGSNYYEKPLSYGNRNLSGITMYATHAQITMPSTGQIYGDRGYAPSLAERETKAENILNWSKTNYSDIANYAHNAWIYMGLGGYVQDGDEQYATVTNHFNNYLNGKLDDMDTNGYYPIGIVFMNDAISDATSATANKILQLNNKYRKAYDPDRSPIDGSDITRGAVQSAAPGYSSGMSDHNTDAIGWTKSR